MASPVRGLRPFRAERCLMVNVPNPAMATVSPAARASAMAENMALTAVSASVRNMDAAAARDNSSDLFIPVSPGRRLVLVE